MRWHFFSRMWHEQDGVLSFEWTMLASLLTVGVVAGVASVRDGVIDEMGDLTRSMTSLDQSYRIQPPLVVGVHSRENRITSTKTAVRIELQ